MPIATPFHDRTSKLCTSLRFKDWAGYHAVCSYDTCHEREYYAFRHGAGLLDVTPLYKYDVRGDDATRFLQGVIAKDVGRLKVGQVTYCCWCDDDGKVLDDGTVTRLDEQFYRLTAAEPCYAWLNWLAQDFSKVEVEETTDKIAALSLQGPTSRDLLSHVCQQDMTDLKFFRMQEAQIGAKGVQVSRTGYTGDLGYEIWTSNEDALAVWDALMEAGRNYALEPCGLDALDVTRVEAGFIMNGVDYFSANHCMIEARKSTPYELGLGWTVQLDREPFIGQEALKREKEKGSQWKMVGLDIDWVELETLFRAEGLPPQVSSQAWRTPVPIYDGEGGQVGYATSGSWSPILKKNLALATVEANFATPGAKLQIEATVEFRRQKVTATVTKTPFFNPKRKRA